MSGLTPILDTLLTQVLGKKSDLGPPRSLRPGQIVTEVRGAAPAPGTQTSGVASQPRPPLDGAAPAGAPTPTASVTRLSQPALLIARAQQTPGEGFPPTVRTPGLLLEHSSPARDSASTAAQRLGDSIRGSGLFYESHLQRWYRGELPSSELAKEPQMRLWRPSPRQAGSSASPPAVGPATGSGEGSKDDASRVTPSTTKTLLTPGSAEPARNRAPGGLREFTAPAPEDRLQNGPELQDRLQSIVRNQLELLGTPVLRWEGEVNDGFLMFMEINLRSEEEGSDAAKQGSGCKDGDEAGAWSTEIELELPQLGEMTVSMRRASGQLSVRILSQRDDTAALLTARLGTFIERIRNRGVEAPAVQVMKPGGAGVDRGGA